MLYAYKVIFFFIVSVNFYIFCTHRLRFCKKKKNKDVNYNVRINRKNYYGWRQTFKKNTRTKLKYYSSDQILAGGL